VKAVLVDQDSTDVIESASAAHDRPRVVQVSARAPRR
jgi:hypothetical protein